MGGIRIKSSNKQRIYGIYLHNVSGFKEAGEKPFILASSAQPMFIIDIQVDYHG